MADALTEALAAIGCGLADMGRGDARAYKACWADSVDSTLFGAFGTVERGRADIEATLDWVASRFSGGPLVPTYDIITAAGPLAYTVGVERGVLSTDGRPPAEVVIRVTHVLRLVGDEYKIVHRHGDHPPTLAAPPRLGAPADEAA